MKRERTVTTKKTVDTYISELTPAKRRMAEALREPVLAADPKLQESVKWGNPAYTKNGNVCYIAQAGDHMNLGFFQGAKLTDPEGHIEGTGKGMRHIKIRSLDDISQPQFSSWVREAVALNKRT